MAWITITESDLQTVLSGPELDAYREAALASGQLDPIQPTIDQVTDLARGYVAASGKYVLGDSGIPQKLLAPALDIIAFRIPSRVGQTASESRQTLNDQAVRLLEQVAAGEFGIEEPLVETSETIGAPSPRITARTRSFTRDDQDGL